MLYLESIKKADLYEVSFFANSFYYWFYRCISYLNLALLADAG